MSDLAKAFAGLKQDREPDPPRGSPGLSTRAPKNTGLWAREQGPRLAPLPLQGTAKSTHPAYTAVKVFVRRETHRAAGRKWQDEQDREGRGGDFSDLVERLLQAYLGA